MNFRKGAKVYAVRPGNSQVGEYKFALAGIDHAFLHMPPEHWALEGTLFPIPLTHVFCTKAEAKAFANTMLTRRLAMWNGEWRKAERKAVANTMLGVQVGDLVAVASWNTYSQGLVIKTTDTMFEMLLSNEEDIQHHGGKSKHYKRNVIVLIRGSMENYINREIMTEALAELFAKGYKEVPT